MTISQDVFRREFLDFRISEIITVLRSCGCICFCVQAHEKTPRHAGSLHHVSLFSMSTQSPHSRPRSDQLSFPESEEFQVVFGTSLI